MTRRLFAFTMFVAVSVDAAIDNTRCKVGLSFSGLGPELSGDFIGDGNAFYRFTDRAEFYLGFTWTDPDHPQHTTYGCDFLKCSPDDQKLAAGKWGIISNTDAGAHHTLLAVCEEGCPDLKPSCADIFNQRNCTESHTEDGCLHCPIWPAAWNSTMRWRIVNTAAGGHPSDPQIVSADSYCCKRKPMECDMCDQDTCPHLIGLFHNNCPPNGGGLVHRQSKLQKDCCEQHESHIGKFCTCGIVPTECDHSIDQEVV